MDKGQDEIVGLLQDIKRLMIAALLRDGASQGEVAKSLGVSQSSISRLFPSTGKAKPVERK